MIAVGALHCPGCGHQVPLFGRDGKLPLAGDFLVCSKCAEVACFTGLESVPRQVPESEWSTWPTAGDICYARCLIRWDAWEAAHRTGNLAAVWIQPGKVLGVSDGFDAQVLAVLKSPIPYAEWAQIIVGEFLRGPGALERAVAVLDANDNVEWAGLRPFTLDQQRTLVVLTDQTSREVH